MKIRKYGILILCSLFCSAASMFAQEWEQLEVPLTAPGEPGQLVVNLVDGGIEVIGHNQKTVIVEVRLGSKGHYKNKQSKNGMQKVANSSLKYTVKEIDNKVVVSYVAGSQVLDFRIKVPRNFSLKLKTINRGAILAENVNGEHEISNINGEVTLVNIGGSAIVDALNKNITVNFTSVTPDTSMAFTSLNGVVDVSFPSDIKANIDAQSEFGDVYSDFSIQPVKTKIKGSKNKNGVYNVTRNKGIKGTINGGGQTISFKTLNGDILIRSN